MPSGVMNIKHLLCDSTLMHDDTVSEDNFSSILLQKSLQNQAVASFPHGAEVEFWKHCRSNSTRSSCSSSTSSSSVSSIGSTFSNSEYAFNTDHYYHYHHSVPIIENRQQRVNIELCRSYTALINVNEDLIATKKKQPLMVADGLQKSRCNSTPNYVQTRTPWTPQEDRLLQKGYEQGLSWAMISSTYLPNRSRGCCWGRFKTLQSRNVIDVYQKRICQRPWKVANLKSKSNNRH